MWNNPIRGVPTRTPTILRPIIRRRRLARRLRASRGKHRLHQRSKGIHLVQNPGRVISERRQCPALGYLLRGARPSSGAAASKVTAAPRKFDVPGLFELLRPRTGALR